MIQHLAFIDLLCRMEREGRKAEWHETRAGLLVLRLYRLWLLEPAVADANAAPAAAVRAVVDELPESADAKTRLTLILDAMRGPPSKRATTLARRLCDYAGSLARQAHWGAAHDVRAAAALHCSPCTVLPAIATAAKG